MLPGRRKPARPRGRPARVKRAKGDRARKLDKSIGKINVHKASEKTSSPKVTRPVRRIRGVRKPPIKIVEPGQRDPGKEPVRYLSPITDTERKIGTIPTDPDEIIEDEELMFPQYDPVAVNISLFTYEEKEKMAVLEVTETARDNELIVNSVHDPRFGSYDPREACQMCNQTSCNGHYGIIKFPEEYPVPNPVILKIISQTLNCVCNSCGKLLVTENTLEAKGILKLQGEARFKAVVDRCQGPLKCSEGSKKTEESLEILELSDDESETIRVKPGVRKICSTNPTFYPQISENQGWIAYRISKDEKEYHMMDPKKVFDILDAITDEDARLMGFAPDNHPRNMVLRALLVFPTSGRQPNISGATTRADQLTEFFNRIVRAKNNLMKSDNLGGKCECYKEMTAAVKDLMDGKKSPYPNRPVMPLRSRIQGKGGIYRGFMMGKRTNHCGRTVLGPDSSLRFGEIRIPTKIADTLVTRVNVHQYNKRAIEEMVDQGKVLFYKNPGDKTFTKYRPGFQFPLKIGMIIDRKLQNGDMMPFNRQPTLHKYSLMAYTIVIGKQDTIGLHLAVTPPHNADQIVRRTCSLIYFKP